MTVTVTVVPGPPCGSGVSVRTRVTTPLDLRPLVQCAREGDAEQEREHDPGDDEHRADGAAPPRGARVRLAPGRALGRTHGE